MVISDVNKLTDNIIDYPFFLVVKWCFGCKIGKIRYILIPTLCFFFRKSSDSKKYRFARDRVRLGTHCKDGC